ncbi:MAG TPA: phosphate acyltransferase PlsX [Candidatus Dormibacteraeota bacterium]|nr:phosphate acyltransferase PlsX [Candidatus Dormibacteraeota bacterium]
MARRDSSLPIALDAMGGDHAPAETVRGAALAARDLGVSVALVGRRADVERELSRLPEDLAAHRSRLSVIEATEVIAMDEHPAQAVRARKDASIVVACRAVADGRARAAVSAGNSGAVLASALFTAGRVRGVSRPAIGGLIPTATERMSFVLDIGANTDCRPEWLAQFAVMGSVYAVEMMSIREPRVALLSNGEERGKGSELVQAATPLLEAAPVNFRGNVEGKDLFRGTVDVIVCDGFAGNVALKVAEGTAEFLLTSISTIARQSLQGKLGGLLLKPRLRPIRDKVDYRKTGGALLLGIDGEVVVAHGRSDAEAVMNAIRVADSAARRDVSGVIASRLAAMKDGATSPEGDTAAGTGDRAAQTAPTTEQAPA